MIVCTWSPSFLRITIKQSKTDPFRKWVELYVGRANSDLCPVAAVLSYLTCRGTGPGPLFVLGGGQGLTRSRFVSLVRSTLDKVGVVLGPRRRKSHIVSCTPTDEELGRGTYSTVIILVLNDNEKVQLAGKVFEISDTIINETMVDEKMIDKLKKKSISWLV